MQVRTSRSKDSISILRQEFNPFLFCRCEFYYISFGDELIEDDMTESILHLPKEPVWAVVGTSGGSSCINRFSLVHHDLNVCTNSLQYSVVLDVLNNLLLYVDPTLLSRTENYMRTKYKLLLFNIDDQKKPIIHLQSNLRCASVKCVKN